MTDAKDLHIAVMAVCNIHQDVGRKEQQCDLELRTPRDLRPTATIGESVMDSVHQPLRGKRESWCLKVLIYLSA